MELDAAFNTWSEDSKAAPFPPTATTIDGLIDCYVMKSSVSEAIAARMGEDAQRLLVKISGASESFDLVNPCGELVSVDETKASLQRFPSSGRIYDISRYSFKKSDVDKQYLFRTNLLPHVQLCTDEFRSDALTYGWEPLIFVPVWDSEHAPFAHTPDRDEIASRPEIYGPKGFKSVPERLMPKEWLSS